MVLHFWGFCLHFPKRGFSFCLASFLTSTSPVSFSSPSVPGLPHFLCLNNCWLLFNSSVFLLRLWQLLWYFIFFFISFPYTLVLFPTVAGVSSVSWEIGECYLHCLIWDTSQTICTLSQTAGEEIVPHILPGLAFLFPSPYCTESPVACVCISTSWA